MVDEKYILLLDNFSNKIIRWIFPEERKIVFSTSNKQNNPHAEFILCTPRLATTLKILINPLYWGPESYARGEWHLQKGDLADFFAYTLENLDNAYGWYFNYLSRRKSLRHYAKQRMLTKYFTRQVVSHYEIDSAIYSCFLDSEMVYTCAFYDQVNDLSTAQQIKYKTIMERLELIEQNSKVLNIGSGWGSFERFMAHNHHNSEITGLSISKSQIAWADTYNKSSLTQEQLSRVNYFLEDYINHWPNFHYDAVVAIGMVEHVGLGDYSEFFCKVYGLLRVGGRLLIHMIVKAESELPTNPWIDKHIFPGGYCPSIKEIVESAEPYNYRIKGIFTHDPTNYKKTLAHWKSNLTENRNRMIDIYKSNYKYTDIQAEYLFRQWEVYLAGSEASFSLKNKPHQIAQFIFEKTG